MKFHLKKLIKNPIRKFLYYNRSKNTRQVYDNQIYSRLVNIPNIDIDIDLEKQYVDKWKKYDKNVIPEYFRVYSHLSGVKDLNHIPDFLYYTLIEPQLNQYSLGAIGDEKNYYSKIITNVNQPKILLRNINGIFCDENYNKIALDESLLFALLKAENKIFIKPSLDTGQGKNARKFINSGNEFISTNGEMLSLDFLNKNYIKNYIIQEFIPQCELLNSFNSDSINTLRILTFRSFISNEVNVVHTTLRVAKKGGIIDASRTGGRFCGVLEDGSLKKQIYDAKGFIYEDFNGINIVNNDFKIPNFDKVLECAKLSADPFYHHRVLALDIMIDANNLPRLIEVNPIGQGMFIFQATLGPMFGEYTQEILDYCYNNRENLKTSINIQL